MRFSVIGVTLFMAVILTTAVILTNHYREVHFKSGSGVAVFLLKSSDMEGIQNAMGNENSPLMSALHQQGVSFNRCYTSSPWYPSFFASLMTGLHPSEHGLHRGHAYLSTEVTTVAEKLGMSGYRTMVACGKESPLKDVNALQGFSFVEITEPKQTIASFTSFLGRVSVNRPFFAVVEVDIDAFGGPELLDKVVDILFDSVGREAFLEDNILSFIAPTISMENTYARRPGFTPTIPALFLGKPLQVASGKCVLKSVSVCDLRDVIYNLAVGQGFCIRDSMRTGKPSVYEAIIDPADLPRSEVTQPPPYYYRAIWFDNDPNGYSVYPETEFQILTPEGEMASLPLNQAAAFRSQYDLYLANRCIAPDLSIPHTAGAMLDAGMAARLGGAWQQPEYLGQCLHAVEHCRMAEALGDAGFPALAVSELNMALVMNPHFAHAHFLLARIYSSVDRNGAKKHFRTFIDKFGGFSEYSVQVEEARRYLADAPE